MSRNINTKEACVYSGFRESVGAHIALDASNNISDLQDAATMLTVSAECSRCGARYKCFARGGKIVGGSVSKSQYCDS